MNLLEEIVQSTDGETRKAFDELVHALASSLQENKRLQQEVEYIKHSNQLLKKKLFGSASEKMKSDALYDQQDVFNEFELCAEVIELAESIPTSPDRPTESKKRSGRKPLPKNLPRKIVEHDLSDQEKYCVYGHEMSYIGVAVSEELDYVPAQFTVIEHRRKKYSCSACHQANQDNPLIKAQLKTAIKPAMIIPKSMASPSLLSAIVIAKFCDHLPLYRLEGIFKRVSVELSRQVMSTWVLKVSDAVIPLVNLLQDQIMNYDVAFSDETTLQVLNEPNRRAQTKSYLWCFIGGPPDQRSLIYQYHPSRSGEIAAQFFDGYQGALHCDGYTAYNALLASDDLIGINCWAHVRRKFVEALPNGKEKGISGYVVKQLRALYQIEASLKAVGADKDRVKAVRQEESTPILKELKTYLDERVTTVPPQSPVGKAIHYTLKRWEYLITYLEDGRYEIDNNRCERAIKPFVMGRKAWLFANSELGAHASARLFTLIETAKANQVEPLAYLTHIFKELPNCKTLADYEALLPWALKSRLFKFKA